MTTPAPTTGSGTMAAQLYRNKAGKIDISIETILLSLVYISVGLRLWSRRLQRVDLQLNDYFILCATVLMTARTSIMVVVVAKCGVGLHVKEVVEIAGPGIFVLFGQLLYALDLLWVSLVSLIKLSILHFYLKIFTQRAFRIAVFIMMGIVSSFWIGAFFAGAFFCNPPEKQWHPEVPGTCGNRKLYTSIPSSTDLGLDILVILLPMPILWGLQLPTAKKIALTGIFSLGFLIIAITGYRIKPMLALDPTDVTWSSSTIGVLASIVPLLGIINANLPLMAPAFKNIFGSSALATAAKGSDHIKDTYNKRQFSHHSDKRHFSQLGESELPLVDMKGPAPHAYAV